MPSASVASAVTVNAGRFGPYVKWGKINATISKSLSADDLTLEDALRLIAEKEGPGAARRAAKKAPAKKPGAKKAPAKKAPAKKAAAKKKAPAKKAAAKKKA